MKMVSSLVFCPSFSSLAEQRMIDINILHTAQLTFPFLCRFCLCAVGSALATCQWGNNLHKCILVKITLVIKTNWFRIQRAAHAAHCTQLEVLGGVDDQSSSILTCPHCSEKAPLSVFSYLKVPTSCFTLLESMKDLCKASDLNTLTPLHT